MAIADIIKGYYTSILQRDADSAGLDTWTHAVEAGVLTLEQVRAAFVLSPEAQTDVVPLILLYQAAFNRVPDKDGLDAWADQLRAGMTLEQLSEQFTTSVEFKTIYGSGSDLNVGFITALYVNVLGRIPESAQIVQDWLHSGLSRAEMLLSFSHSSEAIARSSGPIAAFLDHAAQGTESYTGNLFDAEHDVHATQTFTLTTGIDEGPDFTGGAANDLFRATGATLTPFDSLDGGAGNDTLRVILAGDANALPFGVQLANIENLEIKSGVGVASSDVTAWTSIKHVDLTVVGSDGEGGNDANLIVGNVETVTADVSGDLNLTVASADTIDVKTGDYADVYVTGDVGEIVVDAGISAYVDVDGGAGSISVTAGDYASVNANGGAGSIDVTAGGNANVNAAGGDDSIDIKAGYDANVHVAGGVGSIVANVGDDAHVSVDGHADSINVTAGNYATVDAAGGAGSIDVTAGGNANVTGLADSIGVTAGDEATVNVSGDVDAITVAAGINDPAYDWYGDVQVTVDGNANSITVDSGEDVGVQVGNHESETVGSVTTLDIKADDRVVVDVTGNADDVSIVSGRDENRQGETIATIGGDLGTMTVNAGDYADVHVAGDAGSITVDAGFGAVVEVLGDAEEITVDAGADADVRVVGDAGIIAVTADGEWSDVNVEVEGSAGDITVDSSDDATVHVGYVYDPEADSQIQGLDVEEESDPYLPSGSEGSVDTVSVTAGDDAHVDVAGDAGSITVNAVDNAVVYVGWNQYSEENGWSGTGSAGTVDVAAGNDAEVDVAGSAEAITVNAGGDANVYVGWGAEDGEAPGTAGTINVTAGSEDVSWSGDVDVEVAGDAGSITVDSGEDAYVQVGYTYGVEVPVEGQDEPDYQTVTVVSSVDTLDITADDRVNVDITGNAGDIVRDDNGQIIAGDSADVSIVSGRDASRQGETVVTIGGDVSNMTINAGDYADVHVAGDAGSITVDARAAAPTLDINVQNYEYNTTTVDVAGSAGNIEVNAGNSDATVLVGYETWDGEIGTGTGSAGTINVTTDNYAYVDVAGNSTDSITVNAGGDADVYVGYGNGETGTGTAGTIDVTAGTDGYVDVAGGADSITVDAQDDATVYVGYTSYTDDSGDVPVEVPGIDSSVTTVNVTAGSDAYVEVTGSVESITATSGDETNIRVGFGADGTGAGTVDTINVTAGVEEPANDWYGDVDVEVAGNAGSITIDSGEDVDVEVGYEYDVEVPVEGQDEPDYQTVTVVSSVGTLDITADDEVDVDITGNAEVIIIAAGRDENREGDADIDVAGTAGSITVDARDDVDIDVGFGNDGDTGAAGTAGTIDVTTGDSADIEVAGNADIITVTAGGDVDVEVGYTYEVEVPVEGQDEPDLETVTVVSNVETLDLTSGNDVDVEITGNASDITITAGTDPVHNGEVEVNVGGSIDSLSITGAKNENWYGGRAVDVSAASIGMLSLTDINKAVLDVDGNVVRGDAQNVSVLLTGSTAESNLLNLTVAGAVIDLLIDDTGLDNQGNPINVETLNLTVGKFSKVLDSQVPPPLAAEPSQIDSYVALNSTDVRTLNIDDAIDGAGNLELNVSNASALSLIDASAATGDITVTLPGNEGAVSYLGGSGVDDITLQSLPQAVVGLGLGWNFTLDGGDGDADRLTTSASLASGAGVAGTAGSITNFEILNLTGVEAAVAAHAIETLGQNLQIDATLFGTDHVILDGVGAYESSGNALDLTIADGGTVEVGGSGLLNVDVDTAEGDTGSLNLVLNGDDQVMTSFGDFTIYGIDVQTSVSGAESISIDSAGHGFELDTQTGIGGVTINALGLDANQAKTITITGDAFLDLTDDALDLADRVFNGGINYQSQTHLDAVTTIDASKFDAGLVLDLSGNTNGGVAVTVGNGLNVILASQGNDTITVGDGSNSPAADVMLLPPDGQGLGNVIWGGLGKDIINLGAGTAADVLVYTHALESNGVNVDVVNGFQAHADANGVPNGVNDILDFSGVNFAYNPSDALHFGGYIGESQGYGSVLTALENGQVRFVLDSTANVLYGDVNADGALTSSDFAIQLTGVTDLSAANFHFQDWFAV